MPSKKVLVLEVTVKTKGFKFFIVKSLIFISTICEEIAKKLLEIKIK